MSILRSAAWASALFSAFWAWMLMPLFSLTFAVSWLLLTPWLGKRAMGAAGKFIGIMCLFSVLTLVSFTAYTLIEYVKVAS